MTSAESSALAAVGGGTDIEQARTARQAAAERHVGVRVAAGVILGSFFESLFPEPESSRFADLRGDRDLGEGDVVQQQLDFRQRPDRRRGVLKAPSLRNVWQNPLYFHEGRFSELTEVIDYSDDHLALGLRDRQARCPRVPEDPVARVG